MPHAAISLVHVVAAICAIGVGSLVLAARKGTRTHRRLGWSYLGSMLLLDLTALQIYRLTGAFGPFHYAAIFSLATVLAGFVAARRRRPRGTWVRVHLLFMAWSYIGLLAAAASEIATRVPTAPFWPAVAGSTLAVLLLGGIALARWQPRLLARHGAGGKGGP